MILKNFQKVTQMLGGPTKVSKIIGLKSNRYVRVVLNGNRPIPSHWITKIGEHVDKLIGVCDD